MALPDLVFITADNREKVEARIAPHVKAHLAKQAAIENERAAFEKSKIDEALAKQR